MNDRHAWAAGGPTAAQRPVRQAVIRDLDAYTALPYSQSMFTFIESPLFTRLVGQYLSDEEYRALQEAIAANPEAGAVIPGSGGVRKLRWGVSGGGKRGGVRVIYFQRVQRSVIWMLTIYSKKEADTIPVGVLRKIRKEIENE